MAVFRFIGERHFLLGLIAPTEVLQERRCLGILPGRVLCSCILCGPDRCILLSPDLCAGMSLGSDLSPRILYGPEVSVLLYGLGSCRGILLHNLCGGILHNVGLGILYGLYGHDQCPRIFVGRPSLELIQQGFGWWLTDFGLLLIGKFRSGCNFVARRRALCSRRQNLRAGS